MWTKREIEDVLINRPMRYNENVTLDEVACAVFQVEDEGNVSKHQVCILVAKFL